MRDQILRRPLTLLLAISALALLLAYQFRASIVLEMNSLTEEQYLTRGFYAPEERFGITYRWSSGR